MWFHSKEAIGGLLYLLLEYKLYAVRHPEAREKLLFHYDSCSAHPPSLVELLLGKNLSKPARAAIQRRMAVLGSTFSGLVLESRFHPDLLPPRKLEPLAPTKSLKSYSARSHRYPDRTEVTPAAKGKRGNERTTSLLPKESERPQCQG